MIYKVFARAPGFPHWPGFITEDAPNYVYDDEKTKDSHYCVFFFNSWDYALFPKISTDVLEHIKLSKSTVNWNENYEKFSNINKKKKTYLSGLEEGQTWTDEQILAKLKKVADAKKTADQKSHEDVEKKKTEKTEKLKKTSVPRKRTSNAQAEKPSKRARPQSDPLKNLLQIKNFLESKIFAFPNNENIAIEPVKVQLEKLRTMTVNFEILKNSRIGKIVKKISKLSPNEEPEKSKKSDSNAIPSSTQIKLLVDSGITKSCHELVAHWTSILTDQGVESGVNTEKLSKENRDSANAKVDSVLEQSSA